MADDEQILKFNSDHGLSHQDTSVFHNNNFVKNPALMNITFFLS